MSFACRFMTLVLRTIPIKIPYAVWSGIGIVLIAVIRAIYYRQLPDMPAVIGIGLIMSGVVIIHLFSKTFSH